MVIILIEDEYVHYLYNKGVIFVNAKLLLKYHTIYGDWLPVKDFKARAPFFISFG